MTITLYHAQNGAWERTVLPDAWARWNWGADHSGGYSRTDQGESLLLIPWREGLAIAPGDGVLDGEGPEIGPGPLKAADPEIRQVTEAALYRPGSPLDHWEVKAR